MTPTMTEKVLDNSIDDNKTQIRIDLNAALISPELSSPKSHEESKFL